MLKGLYFPCCDFIEAGRCARRSWGWSSIVEGRDSVREGATRQVVSGESIKMWSNPSVLSVGKL